MLSTFLMTFSDKKQFLFKSSPTAGPFYHLLHDSLSPEEFVHRTRWKSLLALVSRRRCFGCTGGWLGHIFCYAHQPMKKHDRFPSLLSTPPSPGCLQRQGAPLAHTVSVFAFTIRSFSCTGYLETSHLLLPRPAPLAFLLSSTLSSTTSRSSFH